MKNIINTEDYTTIPEGVIFSASWIFANVVWSNTYKFIDGECYRYNHIEDCWDLEESYNLTNAAFSNNYVAWFTYIG